MHPDITDVELGVQQMDTLRTDWRASIGKWCELYISSKLKVARLNDFILEKVTRALGNREITTKQPARVNYRPQNSSVTTDSQALAELTQAATLIYQLVPNMGNCNLLELCFY